METLVEDSHTWKQKETVNLVHSNFVPGLENEWKISEVDRRNVENQFYCESQAIASKPNRETGDEDQEGMRNLVAT